MSKKETTVSTEIKLVNPYWEEARDALVGDEYDYQFIIKSAEARERCCRMYAWAIPDPASLAFVARHLGTRAIELGAGTGYWAWQLSHLGVDILAYDKFPPDTIPNAYFAPNFKGEEPQGLVTTWYPVQQGEPEVLAEHPDRTLFLCWPPYGGSLAHECLQVYRGDRVIFIGEGCGGCTGDDDFFALLDKEWQEIAAHPIQQWRHIHDGITVYERIKKDETDV